MKLHFVNPFLPPYDIFPLGDSALTLDFGNVMSEETNRAVLQIFSELEKTPLPGMTEAVPGYSSLAIYYDPLQIRKFDEMTLFLYLRTQLENFLASMSFSSGPESRHIRVPVCYDVEMGPDLPALAEMKGLEITDIIRLHTGVDYRIYMMGFLPGFAYMGMVNEKITAPRKKMPKDVRAGSVGIAGSQTGIYPLDSPGGWQIVGRTPLKLFDPGKEEVVYFRAGDQVRFYSITRDEFENYQAGPS